MNNFNNANEPEPYNLFYDVLSPDFCGNSLPLEDYNIDFKNKMDPNTMYKVNRDRLKTICVILNYKVLYTRVFIDPSNNEMYSR